MAIVIITSNIFGEDSASVNRSITVSCKDGAEQIIGLCSLGLRYLVRGSLEDDEYDPREHLLKAGVLSLSVPGIAK